MAHHTGAGDRIRRREARPQRPVWPTLRRAVALQRPHAGLVITLLAVIVGAALAGLGPPWLIQRIIDDALPRAGQEGEGGLLNSLILLMVGIVAVGAVLGVAQSYLSNVIGQSIMFDLRSRLFSHLTRMSLRWFTANRTGEVLSRVSNDVGAVQGVVSDTLTGIVGNFIVAATTFGLMLFFDWRLALFSVAFLPFFLIPARRVGNRQRALMAESQEE
ncbi:MAG: ABC transporter transmembrane domain-containing protein, partial [Dehalococcoidia bacterium]